MGGPSLPIMLFALSLIAAARGAQVISAADPAFVRPLGRAFPSAGGLGFSWLGGGLHVSHTGSVLRATVLAHPSRPLKFATYESTQGNDPWQGVVIIPATALNESFVASAGGAGEVKLLLNLPPDYWAAGADSAVILALETDGAFNAAPPAPGRVLHVLGDSITAATNVRGGFPRCADEGLCEFLARTLPIIASPRTRTLTPNPHRAQTLITAPRGRASCALFLAPPAAPWRWAGRAWSKTAATRPRRCPSTTRS
jgi:hypothetical protein